MTWNKQTGPCPFGPYQITTEHGLFGYRGKFDPLEEIRGRLKTLAWSAPILQVLECPHGKEVTASMYPASV